jgi:hypothetical protein
VGAHSAYSTAARAHVAALQQQQQEAHTATAEAQATAAAAEQGLSMSPASALPAADKCVADAVAGADAAAGDEAADGATEVLAAAMEVEQAGDDEQEAIGDADMQDAEPASGDDMTSAAAGAQGTAADPSGTNSPAAAAAPGNLGGSQQDAVAAAALPAAAPAKGNMMANLVSGVRSFVQAMPKKEPPAPAAGKVKTKVRACVLACAYLRCVVKARNADDSSMALLSCIFLSADVCASWSCFSLARTTPYDCAVNHACFRQHCC